MKKTKRFNDLEQMAMEFWKQRRPVKRKAGVRVFWQESRTPVELGYVDKEEATEDLIERLSIA